MLTIDEQERLAYVTGDTDKAALLAQVAGQEQMQERLSSVDAYLQDAAATVPGEDFMQDLIDEARAMAKGRITKAEMLAFVERLESFQSEKAGEFEYLSEQIKEARSA